MCDLSLVHGQKIHEKTPKNTRKGHKMIKNQISKAAKILKQWPSNRQK